MPHLGRGGEEEMSESRKERLNAWARKLTNEQLVAVTVALADDSIDSEMVRFSDSQISPSWEHTGEPIVPGQKVYEDE